MEYNVEIFNEKEFRLKINHPVINFSGKEIGTLHNISWVGRNLDPNQVKYKYYPTFKSFKEREFWGVNIDDEENNVNFSFEEPTTNRSYTPIEYVKGTHIIIRRLDKPLLINYIEVYDRYNRKMNLKINKTHDENSNPCYNYEGENHTEITCNSNNNCVWIPKNDNDFNKYNNSIDNRCYSIIEIDFEKPNHVCGDSLGNIEDSL